MEKDGSSCDTNQCKCWPTKREYFEVPSFLVCFSLRRFPSSQSFLMPLLPPSLLIFRACSTEKPFHDVFALSFDCPPFVTQLTHLAWSKMQYLSCFPVTSMFWLSLISIHLHQLAPRLSSMPIFLSTSLCVYIPSISQARRDFFPDALAKTYECFGPLLYQHLLKQALSFVIFCSGHRWLFVNTREHLATFASQLSKCIVQCNREKVNHSSILH